VFGHHAGVAERCRNHVSGAHRFNARVDRRYRKHCARIECDVQRTGQYQGALAYVYVGDVMRNAELVRQGFPNESSTC
jgi:endonuclease YncB( thermonuclease family)